MRIFGRWAGRPHGTREDPARCVVQLSSGRSPVSRQCSRKRGYGRDGEGAFNERICAGELCAQHAVKQAKGYYLYVGTECEVSEK